MLAFAIVVVAQSASASPMAWPDEVMPLVLTHPEFFGIGDGQWSGGAEANRQGHPGLGGSGGDDSLLYDPLSTSQQDDGVGQSGGAGQGQNYPGQNGPGHHGPPGPTDEGFAWISPGSETPNSADLFSTNDVTFDTADADVVQTGAAPIPEPTSFELVMFAFLGFVVASLHDRYPSPQGVGVAALGIKAKTLC